MTHDEMIAVIKADKEGKEIEWKLHGEKRWSPGPILNWNFATFDYRVKPEPVRTPLTDEQLRDLYNENATAVAVDNSMHRVTGCSPGTNGMALRIDRQWYFADQLMQFTTIGGKAPYNETTD